MKRTLILLGLGFLLALPAAAAEIEAVTYNNLVAGISRACGPVVSGQYIVFTARGSARHTGIAFENERYTKIRSFQRLIRKDEYGEPQKDADGKEFEPVLFYIYQIPPGMHEIRYRMVIDGLWTTDPQNVRTAYDYANGMNVSTVPVEYYEVFQTNNVNRGQVRFICPGKPGRLIHLAGTFNNWDPFMYEMTETAPGIYELILPLPAGTWYYAYYDGTEQLRDTTNQNRVYTKDGRVASVVTVE